MSETLRGRVDEVLPEPSTGTVMVACRAATLTGSTLVFRFRIRTDDRRLYAMAPGNRVLLAGWPDDPHALALGHPEWPIVLCAEVGVIRAPGESYREGLFRGIGPNEGLKRRARREAERMGYTVDFGVNGGDEYIEVGFARGKAKHYKGDQTWDEVMMRAGLGGTL